MERRYYTVTDFPALARKASARVPRPPAAKPKAKPNRAKAQRLLASTRYTVAASAPSPKVLVLPIRGEIGRSTTAAWVKQRIAETPDAVEISLIVDSPGGGAAEAWDIHNLLRAFRGRITARVVGDCASAAVEILLAADVREAVADATFMLHRTAHGVARAAAEAERLTAPQMRRLAAGLEAEDNRIAGRYAQRLGRPLADIKRLMGRALPFGAAEAKRLGLVHHVIPNV